LGLKFLSRVFPFGLAQWLMDLAALKEIANGDQLRQFFLIGFDSMGSACRFPQFNLKRGIANLLLELWKKLRRLLRNFADSESRGNCSSCHLTF